MKSFAPPLKETKYIHASADDLLHTVLEQESRLMQMPEAATVGVLRKKVFFKISQNSQETPVPGKTPANFAKYLRTRFYRTTPDDCF